MVRFLFSPLYTSLWVADVPGRGGLVTQSAVDDRIKRVGNWTCDLINVCVKSLGYQAPLQQDQCVFFIYQRAHDTSENTDA